MIHHIFQVLPISAFIAETDDGAVGFYRKCQFKTEEFFQEYDGNQYRRYCCVLKKRLIFYH